MRPRLRELGYLAVLAKHSAGRRPAVSSARVWRNGLLYSAQTWPQMTPNRLPPSPAGLCRSSKASDTGAVAGPTFRSRNTTVSHAPFFAEVAAGPRVCGGPEGIAE